VVVERQVGLRERKKRQTREAIARTGLELFAEHGFRATKVSDIAAAADISTRTFFLHFRWKEDLLLEESRNDAKRFADALEARAEGEPTIDVLERVSASLREVRPDPEAQRLRRLTYLILAAEPRLQGHEMVEFGERLRPSLIACYSADLHAAGIADTESPARILAGSTIGALIEEINVHRASVQRGTVDEDPAKFASLHVAIFANLRDAFRTFATPRGGG
jgi:AcrR family transcriptional regulator